MAVKNANAPSSTIVKLGDDKNKVGSRGAVSPERFRFRNGFAFFVVCICGHWHCLVAYAVLFLGLRSDEASRAKEKVDREVSGSGSAWPIADRLRPALGSVRLRFCSCWLFDCSIAVLLAGNEAPAAVRPPPTQAISVSPSPTQQQLAEDKDELSGKQTERKRTVIPNANEQEQSPLQAQPLGVSAGAGGFARLPWADRPASPVVDTAGLPLSPSVRISDGGLATATEKQKRRFLCFC